MCSILNPDGKELIGLAVPLETARKIAQQTANVSGRTMQVVDHDSHERVQCPPVRQNHDEAK